MRANKQDVRSNDKRAFGDVFEQVEVGMTEADVLELLGTLFEELGPGGVFRPPLEDTPTRIWFYGPNMTFEESREPSWNVGFRKGRVLLLKAPED